MRSHILTLSSIICFTATSTTALAQDVAEPNKKEIAPKLVVGANLGLTTAALAQVFPPSNYFKGSGGLFARYYLGKHLAVEGGFNYGHESNRVTGYTYIDNGVTYNSSFRSRMNSYSVPVQLQYHLLPAGSKIRPYFGLGGGIMRRDFHTTETFAPNGGPDSQRQYVGSQTRAFASFTQGVTWQINKKWQINQSLSIIKPFNEPRPTVDFRIGVGYSLFNK